ncbi:uncharacterized protein EV422DRAFT_400223 [Fimicolochytrium jonesii]|uniref:uncharacterized protein n=1 Tax=Fimicolochytrium jonesii TaxID=1396493 RepID=UPI0022FE7E81|nr:uncharacterized protein EV422DRAFT_400223 [Fimicolochytrium jonesii]KAI8822484.1 hypothetical protein EV422DRAFT_400223 [Fimicolochytrium jonesii]
MRQTLTCVGAITRQRWATGLPSSPSIVVVRYFSSTKPTARTARKTWRRLVRFDSPDNQDVFGDLALDPDTGKAGRDDSGRHYTAFLINGDPFDRDNYELTTTKATVIKLLSPVRSPPIILGIGLNYAKHAAELKAHPPAQPILFTKPGTAMQHPDGPILIPQAAAEAECDYEAELAIVIGKRCKNASVENALEHVAGYTCANDVTARKWQRDLGQWCYSKSFDTFCPLGPVLVSPRVIPYPNNLNIRLTLNDELMQSSNTRDMIHNVPHLISFLSQGTTLHPGTVILTGTPEGVGTSRTPKLVLKHGNEIKVSIQGIGTLRNSIVYENTVDDLPGAEFTAAGVSGQAESSAESDDTSSNAPIVSVSDLTMDVDRYNAGYGRRKVGRDSGTD